MKPNINKSRSTKPKKAIKRVEVKELTCLLLVI